MGLLLPKNSPQHLQYIIYAILYVKINENIEMFMILLMIHKKNLKTKRLTKFFKPPIREFSEQTCRNSRGKLKQLYSNVR